VAGKGSLCFETQVGAGVKTVGMNSVYLFFEVAPEAHQTKVPGDTFRATYPAGRDRPSYFFLVVFFVVFFAAFLATFFAIVINHLLSHVCKSKGRAEKSQRISFSCVIIFRIAPWVVDGVGPIRTSNVERRTSNVEVKKWISLRRSKFDV